MTISWRLLAAIPLALFVACDGGTDDDDNGDSGPKDGGGDPCIQANFTSIYSERLNTDKYCNSAGCHDAQTAGGGQNYKLTKDQVHATLLGDTVNSIGAPNYPKRVVANQPDMSFFWIKVSRDDAPLGRMPLARPALQQCDLDAIRMWIMNGAAND